MPTSTQSPEQGAGKTKSGVFARRARKPEKQAGRAQCLHSHGKMTELHPPTCPQLLLSRGLQAAETWVLNRRLST